MSTGMADLAEIAEAVTAAREAGCEQLALLHCVSGYPAPPADCNLRTHPPSGRGLRRHRRPLRPHNRHRRTGGPPSRWARPCIEKHVTLSRADGGPDAAFSPGAGRAGRHGRRRPNRPRRPRPGRLHPQAQRAQQPHQPPLPSTPSPTSRPATPLTESNIRSIRPGHGLAPKYLPALMGRMARKDIPARHAASLVEDPTKIQIAMLVRVLT